MYLIDTQNKKAVPLERKTFTELKLTERYDLQEWIADNPGILGESLLIIQKEFSGFSDTSERLDLLALDEDGRIVVIENKLDDSGRDVVWQALKYASYCASLSQKEICDIFESYLGADGDAKEKLSDFYDGQDFDSIRLNTGEGDQRIILVAANFRKEVTSTVLWLRDYHNVDITCIKVTPYKDGEKLYLDTEQIIPVKDAQDYQVRLAAKKQAEAVSSKAEASRHNLRYRFWEKALPVLRERTGIFINVSPTKDNWIYGASGFRSIAYNVVIRKDGARAELFIQKGVDESNRIFHELKKNETDLASLFSLPLYWRELPNNKTSCISINYNKYGLTDEEHWDDIAEFLANSVAELKSAFQPLLDDILRR